VASGCLKVGERILNSPSRTVLDRTNRKATAMTSRYRKIGYTSAAVLGLFAGAAGIAAAASAGSSSPQPPAAVAPAAGAGVDDAAEDPGVDCENGIDTATGAECDGGPAAAQAHEATEAPSGEVDESDDAAEDPGVDCENGIDTATGAECDGGPAAAQADEATEAPGTEEDDSASAASGIVARATGVDGSTAADATASGDVEADDESEAGAGDEADDGVDHQFEGHEVGENGNGIPDSDDVEGGDADG
jgi:hypothetical protein